MLTKIPDGLSLEAAAPILCAGVTVYKALKQSGLRAGQWVVLRESALRPPRRIDTWPDKAHCSR